MNFESLLEVLYHNASVLSIEERNDPEIWVRKLGTDVEPIYGTSSNNMYLRGIVWEDKDSPHFYMPLEDICYIEYDTIAELRFSAEDLYEIEWAGYAIRKEVKL